MMQAIRWWLFFLVGFFLNAMLTIWPLAPAYQWYRPQWMFMFVILCQLLQPRYFNPLIAWGVGLCLDSLLGTPLGEYAFICAVLAYLTSLLRGMFVRRPFWLQIEKILLLICLGQMLVFWFHAFMGDHAHALRYWAGSIVSGVVWPMFVLFFHFIRQIFRVDHVRGNFN